MRCIGVTPALLAAAALSCSQGRGPTDVEPPATEPRASARGVVAVGPRPEGRGSVPEGAVPQLEAGGSGEPSDDDHDDAGRTATADEAPPPCSRVPGVCCVALQPFGRVPQEYVDAAVEGLRELYGFEVRVLEPVDHPVSAWYEPRRRWRAERLNDYLRDRVPEGCDRIAGMTVQDISTTKGDLEDWGILGLADLPGPASVFSTFRCRRRVHDVPAVERFRRVAIHEVGHTLGLPHCPTYGCFLEDAGGKAETIDRETFLCDVCRERLGWTE